MKTIFLAVELGTAIRNILRSEVLSRLCANGNRVVLLSHLAETGVLDEFANEQVICEQIDYYAFTPLEKFFFYGSKAAFDKLNPTPTREILMTRLKRTSYKYYLAKKLGMGIVPASNMVLNAFESLLNKAPINNYSKWKELFDKYKPDVLVCTYAFLYYYEFPLIKYCRHEKIPCVAINLSWDNITSKGKIPLKVDRFIVWNEIQKDELKRMYPYYTDDNICISGIPQYDFYHTDRSIIMDREQFFAEIGLEPTHKLITYTTSTHSLAPHENIIIEYLADSIKTKDLIGPSRLLVRRSPRDSWEHYRNVRERQDIFFNDPGEINSFTVDKWNPKQTDMIFYSNLLYHSDVVINIASTVTIDAATFDTPVINVAFDGSPSVPYEYSVNRFYTYVHYKHVVNSGGVRVVNNFQDLVDQINEYLRNPDKDQAGRKKLVDSQCYKLDGKACERVAQYILDVC